LKTSNDKPIVSIVMGSANDWEIMQQAAKQLQDFGVAYDARVISAHRSPDLLFDYIKEVSAQGVRCFIAGAGGAAHLAGVLAGKTTLPVLGVPMPSKYLQGMDFAVIHRANAQGHTGGDIRYWRSGCGQCRIICGGDAGIE
jgi:phosphoribosylaminoimidazole carboxylase PurE protein